MTTDDVLLRPDIQAFIRANTGADAGQLALGKNPFPGVEFSQILSQISARTKAKDKLPTWFSHDNILYPSRISVEQTSSEATAAYKASLVSGRSLIDLTGGFGVDTFFFSKRMEEVTHCETDAYLSGIAAHNFSVMHTANIRCVFGNSTERLGQTNDLYDWIYIDPSRRHDVKGKVFLLKDCEPDVPSLLDFYFRYSDNVMVKTAPLLDISAGLSELEGVAEIHLVALENEMKEILWIIRKGFSGQIRIKTINFLRSGNQEFEFILGSDAEARYADPGKYLYEPNAAVMKSGGFEALSAQTGLPKLHPNSHLYTSDDIKAFPGRTFSIDSVFGYSKSEMKARLQGKKANVATRNFNESVADIRKKWKISDGGQQYCFFTTDRENRKIVLLCSKI